MSEREEAIIRDPNDPNIYHVNWGLIIRREGLNLPHRESPASRDADIAHIRELLAEERTQKALEDLTVMVSESKGEIYLFGATSKGLVVAVKEGVGPGSGYFRGWAMDITHKDNPDENPKVISASFSSKSVARLRDGGTTTFPNPLNRPFLDELMSLSEDAIRNQFPEDAQGMVDYINFTRLIGGFHVPRTGPRKDILVGNRVLYNINEVRPTSTQG